MVKRIHGQCHPPTRLFTAWQSMHQRCYNPNRKGYMDYGGRGIRVCMRWHNFVHFANDMGPHPGKGWSLDRKKNDRGYYKRNCQWATQATQSRNSRQAKLTLKQVHEIKQQVSYVPGILLAAHYGVSAPTISAIRHSKRWAL